MNRGGRVIALPLYSDIINRRPTAMSFGRISDQRLSVGRVISKK
ncbi:hypothetical protein ACODM8_10100 [Vibrio ostreicida]|uniref:Uncharacterized protein n=1 Tax=Vibrio ostreicida TaxID=526588 RepID=A0ABT8BXM3_9VIBR|nr:hypothetical protein [Vibrio ostreicida]MDN3611927.1 hypothetical protein [Vibrio ostreicida]